VRGCRLSIERSITVLAISSKCHTAWILARSWGGRSSPQSRTVALTLWIRWER
jgi:hypothetical protein